MIFAFCTCSAVSVSEDPAMVHRPATGAASLLSQATPTRTAAATPRAGPPRLTPQPLRRRAFFRFLLPATAGRRREGGRRLGVEGRRVLLRPPAGWEVVLEPAIPPTLCRPADGT